MRINKFIAQSGYCSRRKADLLIKEGRVFLNGKKVLEPGVEVLENDRLTIDGKLLEIEEKFYYKLNKPVGYISSNYDPYNEKDLNSLMKIDKRFFCAGRLDMDSHGLMLITNDGDLVNKLIHPSKEIDKEYLVKVSKKLTENQVRQFEGSLDLGEGEISRGAKLELLKAEENLYKVTIHQGYKRQIRRMFAHFCSKVLDLQRISIGEIKLKDLPLGQYIELSREERDFLRRISL